MKPYNSNVFLDEVKSVFLTMEVLMDIG